MTYDARIILAGEGPNIMQSIAGGLQTGQMANEIGDQNALRTLYQEQGPGIAAGEQNALNALAQQNPMATLGVQESRLGMDSTRQQMRIREEQLGLARAAGGRAAATFANGQHAAEAQAALAETQQAIAAASAATTPEQWDSVLTQLGQPDMVGQFEDRQSIIAQHTAMSESFAEAIEFAQGGGQDVSAPEAAIARLEETGLTRQEAIAIHDGRVRSSRDPVTGEAQAIDLGGLYTPPQGQQPIPAQAQTLPSVFNQPQPSPQTMPITPQPSPQPSPQIETGTMPGDIDFSTATGAAGLARNVANTLVGAIGLDPAFPENETATTAMQNLATRTVIDIQGAVAGRPSNFLLEMLQQLTITPNRITTGSGRARAVAEQTVSVLQEGIRLNEDMANQRIRPQEQSAALQNIARLESLLADYERLLGGLSGNQGASPDGNTATSGVTSGGTTWEIR